DRVGHGVVDAAQLDRIHAELPGQLVHRALQRINVWHDGRRAHEARRVAVGMHDVDLGLHGAIAVDPRAVGDARDDVGIGPRADLPAFVEIADDLAIAARAQPDVVARL